MRKYFVSYYYADKRLGQGHGCLEITMRLPIRDMADVHSMIECIKSITKFKEIVILNWRRFEEPVALLGFPKASEAA
jgi:hypothetical protein